MNLQLSKLSLKIHTGKFVSEALIFESVNPQYDERLFIESPKNTSSEHFVYKNCFFVFVMTFRTIHVHSMF